MTSHQDPITSAVTHVKQAAEQNIRRVEDYTRASPLPALAAAAAAGYVMRGLPLRALAGLAVRLAVLFVRPAIFLVGAAKIYEFTRNELPGSRGNTDRTPGV
ncbi:MAG TPA: hypothetical protein VG733_02695 [Chthoniobacteraceae bacterium]|nr:hypothetical protein [Chthoniobacteraceae bacterium]